MQKRVRLDVLVFCIGTRTHAGASPTGATAEGGGDRAVWKATRRSEQRRDRTRERDGGRSDLSAPEFLNVRKQECGAILNSLSPREPDSRVPNRPPPAHRVPSSPPLSRRPDLARRRGFRRRRSRRRTCRRRRAARAAARPRMVAAAAAAAAPQASVGSASATRRSSAPSDVARAAVARHGASAVASVRRDAAGGAVGARQAREHTRGQVFARGGSSRVGNGSSIGTIIVSTLEHDTNAECPSESSSSSGGRVCGIVRDPS